MNRKGVKRMNGLKKNLLINVSYQLFVVIIPLVLAPYVGRTIGATGAGIYSYTYSVAYCFALVGMLGVANYGNRTIAAVGTDIDKRSEVFWNIWTIQIIVSVIACIAYLIYIILFKPDNIDISYIQIITVVCSIFDISWFFFGIERFQITVVRNFVVKILNMILIFMFVHDTDDLPVYAMIMVSGTLLNGLLLFPFLKKEIKYKRASLNQMKRHFKPIVILFFPVIAISIYKIMDKVMIGVLSTTTQTGYYEYAEKIIGLPGTVITAVGSVMLPRLSALIGQKDDRQAKFLLQVTMEIMMCLTFAMAGGIFAIATDFAPTFFGKEFSASGAIMMGLTPAVLCQGWANVIRTQYLIPAEKDSIYVQSAWLGAIVNLIMNAILIPHLNAMGAAIGTVCAEFSVATYQSIRIKKELPIIDYLKYTIFYIVPSSIMIMIVKFLSSMLKINSIVLIVLEIFAGGVVYILISGPYIVFRVNKIKGEKI